MRQPDNDPRVIVLSGASGCGKSTVCQRIVTLAQRRGHTVRGVLTLSRLRAGRKVGLDVQDIATGAVQPLAEADCPADGPSTGRFHFHAHGIAWGNQLLRGITACELLLIDELGPLELLHEQGWVAGLETLRSAVYQRAIVVVRPVLVARLAARLENIAMLTVEVTVANRDDLPARILGIKKS